MRLALPAVLAALAAAPLPADEPPRFASDAQVVLLDLVVRDRSDRPVLDLRADEVEIEEDGARCEIASFRLVRSEAATAPGPREPGTGSPASPAATSPAGPSAAPARPALVLLVFDQLAGDAARRARSAGELFAAAAFPPGTSFAVFKAGLGLRVLQPFTTDRARLAPAVRAATTGVEPSREGPLGTDVTLSSESLTEQAGRTIADEGGLATRSRLDEGPYTLGQLPGSQLYFIDSADRARRGFGSLDALLAIVKQLEPVQGRKTVVYFAEGLHTTADTRGLYESMVAAANRANVTFYALDARGLTLSRPDRDSQALLDGASAAAGTPAGSRQDNLIADAVAGNAQANLGVLASDTGGFLIANTDNLRPALDRVAGEVRTYYEAVYVPGNRAADGRFRRIRARVRRAGVTLRTRSGYFATPAGSPTISARELPLLAALDSLDPRHELRVESGALGFRPANGERESVLLVQVPLSEVQLTADETSATYRGHLCLLTLLKDSSGAVVARLMQDSPLSGPLSELERRRRGQAVFRHVLRLPPGRYSLHTAVEDVEAGRLGVDRRDVVVPSAAPGLALSSLAIVRGAAPAGEATAGSDPLRVGPSAVSVALGAAALASDSRALDYFLTVYPAAKPEPLELTLTVRQDGRPVARALPPLPPPEPDGRLPLLGRIAVDSLAPGAYELVALARQGGASVEATAAFAIPAAARLAAAADTPPDPELVRVLAAAAQYAVEYEGTFADLVVEELYEQSVAGGAQRQTTRAELVFARLPGDIPWGSFRDVYELNGRKLHDRDARLETLFAAAPADAAARAAALLRENARYNFGPAERTVNLPTLPLLFLHPRNQQRFAFRGRGTERLAGVDTLVVEFEETARPTVVREGGSAADLPAGGRFWIDARHGAVLRSETRFRFGQSAVATIRTDYRREPQLAAWVPSEMRERYEDLPGAAKVFGPTTEAVARYGGYRRFSVRTHETARVPDDTRP